MFLQLASTVTIRRVRTWLCKRMRRYGAPCGGSEGLSLFPSSVDCMTNTFGYDFRKGGDMLHLILVGPKVAAQNSAATEAFRLLVVPGDRIKIKTTIFQIPDSAALPRSIKTFDM
jgi:hypothetical protein